MRAVAIAALVANVASFSLLWAYRHGDPNMRLAWIGTRNDVLGNLAVLAAALGVFGTGWPDVAVAMIMATLAVQGATIVARQSLAELGQPTAVPAERRIRQTQEIARRRRCNAAVSHTCQSIEPPQCTPLQQRRLVQRVFHRNA